MALFFYNLLSLLLLPVFALVYLYRVLRGKESLAHIGERAGWFADALKRDGRRPRFWVHAVSVGEVMAAAPVLRELRARYPDALILLSTTTTGGRQVAAKNPDADYISALPLDILPFVQTAMRRMRPDVLILMEWEIWPNLIWAAKQHGATVAVVNGRISDAGLRRGTAGPVRGVLSFALRDVDVLAMQSAEDARRAALVGAPISHIHAAGNTKFDESAGVLTPAERADLRRDFGIPPGVPVFICGSTRDAPDSTDPDEEQFIALALQELFAQLPDLQVIVAPRHIERANAVAGVLGVAGRVRLRSASVVVAPPSGVAPPAPASGGAIGRNGAIAGVRTVDPDSPPPVAPPLAGGGATPKSRGNILILDTFGELARAYAVADVAFVGGSLVKRGGQSVFQPLAQGVPAVFGTHMNNQRDIAALAQAAGVGFMVTDAAELADTVHRLLTLAPADKAALSTKCHALIEQNQGVTARALDLVDAARGRN